MTYRNTERTQYYRSNPKNVFLYNKDYCSSTNSPRLNGRLRIRENQLTLKRHVFREAQGTMNWHLASQQPSYGNSFKLMVPSSPFAASLSTSMKSNVDYLAATRFYDKLSTLHINLAQVLAERQQTINLVANTAARLANAYRKIRRGHNPFTGTATTGKASEVWLEYAYGWTPLLGDVHAAMDIAQIAPPPIKVRSSARDVRSYPNSVFAETVYYNGAFKSVYEQEKVHKYSRSIKATVTVSDPSVVFASQLGLTNPALLTWELLPYSFVVDWFVPIGNWLQMQQALLGISLSQRSTTDTHIVVGSRKGTIIHLDKSKAKWAYGSNQGTFFQREKSRVLSVPSIPLPRVKNPLGVSHALSAIALLRQSFGRR